MDWIPLASKTANTAMLLVLAWGLWNRFRPRRHIPAMLLAFVVDLANVLVIEVYARSQGKGAVEQGIEQFTEEGELMQQVHIAVSVLCILGYVVAVATGIRLQRSGKGRSVHRWNAGIFIATRLASYVTSFWMGSA
jgi:uncharacterized membrane protein YozB (DUF420 family)